MHGSNPPPRQDALITELIIDALPDLMRVTIATPVAEAILAIRRYTLLTPVTKSQGPRYLCDPGRREFSCDVIRDISKAMTDSHNRSWAGEWLEVLNVFNALGWPIAPHERSMRRRQMIEIPQGFIVF